LTIWSVGISLVAFVYVFEASHPGIPGEKDLGGGILVVGAIFTSIIFFIGGSISMLVGLLRFFWLSWRFTRRNSMGRAA
jgi:hypothetical protein